MELVALCRTGFEKELAAELVDVTATHGVHGYPKARDGQGYVQFVVDDGAELLRCINAVVFDELVFVRDWFVSAGAISGLPADDRVSPLQNQFKAAFSGHIQEVADLLFLNVDSNEGKALSKLTRGVGSHLKRQLPLAKGSDWLGVLLLLSGSEGFIGVCPRRQRPRWAGGVARLKFPREAPSRATLKLEEAWHHFIPASEWDTRLAPSMKAVDLGAAPGGWTWQLVARSMFVDAVDNGPMAPTLMETGQVTHRQVDGFAYHPPKPVDWLVCDIADKPARVADMIASWAENSWFREAVFNLKLPMKQRYKEVLRCREQIELRLLAAGRDYRLRFKQLYHDREEVTGHLELR